jgi:hypothetical protein
MQYWFPNQLEIYSKLGIKSPHHIMYGQMVVQVNLINWNLGILYLDALTR